MNAARHDLGLPTGRQGFTLLELLVAIAIASIALGLAIPSYRTFQARQELTQTAKTLETNLRSAQNQAFSGAKNCGNASLTLTGWYVTFQSDAYTINARCGAAVGTQRSILLPPGITMSTIIPVGNSLLFRPINQDVGLIDGEGIVSELPSDAIITLTRGSSTATVTVRQSGDIF